MTAPFDDAAVERAAEAVRAEMKRTLRGEDAAEVFARAALTAALAPEPTPLLLVASAIDKEIAKQESNFIDEHDVYNFEPIAQAAIDAYLKATAASGPAPRRLTREEFAKAFNVLTNGGIIFIMEERLRAALAAVGIEVEAQ